MNYGSKGATKMTAGSGLGDKYTYLFVIDNESGEVIEEGRLRTTPEASAVVSIRREDEVAIEVGTHSPWVSRLLEECGHEVLIANPRKTRLIYGEKRKTDKLDAEKLARLARADPELLYPVEHRGATVSGSPGADPLSRCADPLSHPADQPRPRYGQVFRSPAAQVLCTELPQKGRRRATR